MWTDSVQSSSMKRVTKPNRDPSLNLRQQQAHARREQILNVSLELFAQQGFAATPTKQIAQKVGVTEGTIFHYFPDKISILMAVAEHQTFAHQVMLLLSKADDRPLQDVMSEVAMNWAKLIREESSAFGMMLAESQTNEVLNKALSDIIHEVSGRFAKYFAGRVKAGEMRGDVSLIESAMMFLSPLILFFITNRHLSDAEWQKKSTVYARSCLDIWLSGVMLQPTMTKKR